MRVCIGADNAGYLGKQVVAEILAARGDVAVEAGALDDEPVDFPDIADALCAQVLSGNAERGILVCGTGIGACMAANKVSGIRAALAHDVYSAHQCVEHDDANVLCLGAKIVGPWLMADLVTAFLAASFAGTEDYRRRLAKMARLERASGQAIRTR
jgi:ribose 5-phosphate isomerase B